MVRLIASAAYVDDDGRAIVRTKENLEKHLPAFHSEDTRFVATFQEFLHRFAASRASLVNMLAKMEAGGAKIASVETRSFVPAPSGSHSKRSHRAMHDTRVGPANEKSPPA